MTSKPTEELVKHIGTVVKFDDSVSEQPAFVDVLICRDTQVILRELSFIGKNRSFWIDAERKGTIAAVLNSVDGSLVYKHCEHA